MLWLRALAVWGVIMAVETANGILRTLLLAPHVRDVTSRQMAFPVAAACIFLITYLCSNWLAAGTWRAQVAVGIFWAALTLAFEIVLGLSLGLSWQRIGADYNPGAGGLMAFGLAFMALCPWMAARVRGPKTRRDEPSPVPPR